jgi:hypothetical protein
MRKLLVAVLAASAGAVVSPMAGGQEGPRFDRPIFTVEGAVLCSRQEQISAVRHAQEDNDRPAADRMIAASCKVVAPGIRLGVVAAPGLRDPDVEVRVVSAPGLDPSLPRGSRWTLKTMVRN